MRSRHIPSITARLLFLQILVLAITNLILPTSSFIINHPPASFSSSSFKPSSFSFHQKSYHSSCSSSLRINLVRTYSYSADDWIRKVKSEESLRQFQRGGSSEPYRRGGAVKKKYVNRPIGEHDKELLERLRRRREPVTLPPSPSSDDGIRRRRSITTNTSTIRRHRRPREEQQQKEKEEETVGREERGKMKEHELLEQEERKQEEEEEEAVYEEEEEEEQKGENDEEVKGNGLWIDESGAARIGTRALVEGDYLIHADYGFARFEGLAWSREAGGGRPRRIVRLAFAASGRGENKKAELTQASWKLVGWHAPKGTRGVVLSRYTEAGKIVWGKKKAKAILRAEEAAAELVALYAQREAMRRAPCLPDDPVRVEQEVDSGFGFQLTEGQKQALEEVERDMVWRARPMDRLVLGDVGFGKTEVAVRAVHRAVVNGRQAAILAPTTILAAQHTARLKTRFPWMNIAMLRGRDSITAKATRAGLKDGSVEVVVGTTALTAKQVVFRNLGLVVVDEEQRLGVGQKEKLKALARGVDVLTLSATPIPRTLQMALSGMREVSHIDTAPSSRLPVATLVHPWDTDMIKEALGKELQRGGQAFYVVPRIQDVPGHVDMLRRLLAEYQGKSGGPPEIVVAHGSLPAGEAEEVLIDFAMRKGDVLVATTLIENGLDVPTVNTVIVAHAHKLGLASLYQLRGRVGRADEQAYAYFFHPLRAEEGGKKKSTGGKREEEEEMNEWEDENDNSWMGPYNEKDDKNLGGKSMTGEAVQRLAALREFGKLGSGPALAKADLAIRGAGEVLGYEQSGDKGSGVGYDVYMEMLAQALVKVRGTAIEPTSYCRIEVDDGLSDREVLSPNWLPDTFISDPQRRQTEFERARLAPSFDALEEIGKEWKTMYCTTPLAVSNQKGVGEKEANARRKKRLMPPQRLPLSTRLLLIRLHLLLACTTLSGEQLVLTRKGRRLILLTKRLQAMHWDALLDSLASANGGASLSLHPNLVRPPVFKARRKMRQEDHYYLDRRRKGEQEEDSAAAADDGVHRREDEETSDSKDEEGLIGGEGSRGEGGKGDIDQAGGEGDLPTKGRSAMEEGEAGGGGEGGMIIMDLRGAKAAAETALSVLVPLAQVVLEQRQCLSERIGQGRKK